jgi:hypothetical protein
MITTTNHHKNQTGFPSNLVPADIIAGLEAKNHALTAKNDEYPDLVEKRARAERDYNLALSEKLLKAALAGEKMAIIKDVANGDPVVTKLKMDLEICKGVERANQQSIKILIGQIDTYRSLLSWLKAEMQSGG